MTKATSAPRLYELLGLERGQRYPTIVNARGVSPDAQLSLSGPIPWHRMPGWVEEHRYFTTPGGLAAAWDFVLAAGYQPSAAVDLYQSESAAVSFAVVDFAGAGSLRDPMPREMFLEALDLLTGNPEWVKFSVEDDPYQAFLSPTKHGWDCFLDA